MVPAGVANQPLYLPMMGLRGGHYAQRGQRALRLAKARHVWVAILSVIIGSQCRAPSESIPVSTVRDSAGVRIIDLRLSAGGAVPQWRASDVPDAVIGDGRDTDRELQRIRAVALLSQGQIVVANGDPVDLRIFDSTGAFLARLGGEGAGPGEFRDIGMVQPVTGDSILIFDPGLRRTTLMSLDGSHYESAVLAPRRSEANPLGLHTVVGRFRDGTVLAEGVEVVPAAGIVVPQSRVARLNPRLEDAVAVGEFPGSHMAFAPSASGGLMFWDPMFGRRTFYLVDGDGFYVAHSEHWEIRRYDSGGNLHFIVRSTSEPHGLTNRDFDWLLDSIAATRRGRTPLDRVRARGEIGLYATVPAFASVLLDAEGYLWVEEHPPPGRPRGRWAVLGRDGTLCAFALTPPGARVLAVGRGRLLVFHRLPDGEEQVLQYRLTRENESCIPRS